MKVSIYNLQTAQSGNKQVTMSLTRAKVFSSLSLYFTHISSIKIPSYNQVSNVKIISILSTEMILNTIRSLLKRFDTFPTLE